MWPLRPSSATSARRTLSARGWPVFSRPPNASRPVQASERVILVRPHHFVPNELTAADNAFQCEPTTSLTATDLAAAGHAESSALIHLLQEAGVGVDVFEDETTATPDSVFPNNWLTTHADGTVVLYPMYAPNRRGERRADIVDHLRRHYQVQRVVDYSPSEDHGLFLEGTGAMVLDHAFGVAYACRSMRVTESLFRRFCAEFNFTPILFDATDTDGTPIYHTNVMMNVGTHIALVGTDLMQNPADRGTVVNQLRSSGRQVVELSHQQISRFAGNALELRTPTGPVLVMSATAHAALTATQITTIERHARILACPVPIIENAGGSVRCMIAENHLPPRWHSAPPSISACIEIDTHRENGRMSPSDIRHRYRSGGRAVGRLDPP